MLTDLDLENIEASAKGEVGTLNHPLPFVHHLDTLKLVAEVRRLRLVIENVSRQLVYERKERKSNGS